MGLLVLKQAIFGKERSINVRDLAIGLYVATVYQNGKMIGVEKFVKQ
jgi:hypothetical protein